MVCIPPLELVSQIKCLKCGVDVVLSSFVPVMRDVRYQVSANLILCTISHVPVWHLQNFDMHITLVG